MSDARTLYAKLWDDHVVAERDDGTTLIYVDRHLAHEVSTPQSFATLRTKGRAVRHPATNLALVDHAVPTTQRSAPISDPQARAQVDRLYDNARDFDLPLITLEDARQGIVHVVGPELGFTLPGLAIACGDSHTSTHGAFGALAFGIGASECATVMATQCLIQTRARTLAVEFIGMLGKSITAKDMALAMIAEIGFGGASGHAIEYRGEAVRALSMEARMTLCNMSIEAGARVGLVAPDELTFAYCEGRALAPKGAGWEAALDYWRTLASDEGALFDSTVTIDASAIAPQVSWGTRPSDTLPITGRVPDPEAVDLPEDRRRIARALDYMGLTVGMALEDVAIDHVFIGSCTNGRIEDFRAAAAVLAGRRVAGGVTALAVPGSTAVKRQAEEEGLDRIFTDAGFQWREAGCSMCVAINPDRVATGQRCASTSNRNFEGRQGVGSRTHLLSPAMAAAAAVTGHLTDVRNLGEIE